MGRLWGNAIDCRKQERGGRQDGKVPYRLKGRTLSVLRTDSTYFCRCLEGASVVLLLFVLACPFQFYSGYNSLYLISVISYCRCIAGGARHDFSLFFSFTFHFFSHV